MRLHVAVEEEGAGVDDLVAEREPGGITLRGDCGEAVSIWGVVSMKFIFVVDWGGRGGERGRLTRWIHEVESCRHSSSSVCNVVPAEISDALAEDEGFVAVFVHWMGLREGPVDFDDEIDPLAHFGLDDEIA